MAPEAAESAGGLGAILLCGVSLGILPALLIGAMTDSATAAFATAAVFACAGRGLFKRVFAEKLWSVHFPCFLCGARLTLCWNKDGHVTRFTALPANRIQKALGPAGAGISDPAADLLLEAAENRRREGRFTAAARLADIVLRFYAHSSGLKLAERFANDPRVIVEYAGGGNRTRITRRMNLRTA
jgi:hypothetical protein